MISISDLMTRRVAQNNSLVFSSQQQNPYLAHRLFYSHPSAKNNDLPFEFQGCILQYNARVLDLLSLKYHGMASISSADPLQNPPSISSKVAKMSVIKAAAIARHETGKSGLKSMIPLLEKQPNDVGLFLTIIQIYISANNQGAAVGFMLAFMKSLEESENPSNLDVRFAPGLVGLLVTLLKLQGRQDQVYTELRKAAIHWGHRPEASSLLRAAGAELLHSGKAEDTETASDIFQDLRQQDNMDRIAIAGLVAANAINYPERFSSEVGMLTPIPRLIAGIDTTALEDAGIPQPLSTSSIETRKKRPGEDIQKPAKKRFRKKRLPKDYDPSKPPDPERWLPLRDRSTYRPKGKKGKAKAATLTQGGIASADMEVKTEIKAVAPNVRVEKGGAGGGMVNKAKKKKGKGGKGDDRRLLNYAATNNPTPVLPSTLSLFLRYVTHQVVNKASSCLHVSPRYLFE